MASEMKKLNLPYEYTLCAVCGNDNTVIKFKIRLQDKKLSNLWLDSIRYQVNGQETIVICKACGLVYVNPRPILNPAIATYTAEQERCYFEQSYQLRLFAYQKLVHQFPEWLGRNVQTLLDIGCGDGVLLEVAQQAGIQSVGTEISHTLNHLVRDRLGENAIVSSDLNKLQESYDVITLINVLEHARAPDKLLKAANRLLKPDGILVVHVPNFGGLPARLYGAKWRHIEPLEHLYYFTGQTLKKLMHQVDLEPISRFNLIISKGFRGKIQCALGKLGMYLDNGLGIVARPMRSDRLPDS